MRRPRPVYPIEGARASQRPPLSAVKDAREWNGEMQKRKRPGGKAEAQQLDCGYV